MADVTVTATKRFTYRTRDIRKGQRVVMAPVDAAIKAREGFVTLVVGQIVTPEHEPELVPVRRRYRRRDMTAEHS